MLEEREIIRRCQCGQVRLLEVVIARYQDALYTLCRKLTRDLGDADDLFQDTWAAVLRKIDSFSAGGRFRPWLFAICVNRYRDNYRRRRRWSLRLRRWHSAEEEARVTERVASPGGGPDETRERRELHRALRAAIAGLDDRYRLPVLLHYDQGLKMEEIGCFRGVRPRRGAPLANHPLRQAAKR